MRKLQLLAGLSMLMFCPGLFADQVILSNGDRLTGTITKSDAQTLLIKTDLAGDVTVQWPAVQEIRSSQTLHLALQNGKTVAGPVTTTDGSFSVATANAGTVSVTKAEVTALRSDAEQTAYEKSLHPGLLQGWVVGANVGFALTRGNSETKSLALAFTGDRKTSTDEISMYANTVYTTNDAPGAIPGTTADTIQGGARYSHNLTPRMFAFGSGDFLHDELQLLDLRTVLTGGLGFHAIKNDRTTLDLFAGPNYTRENYSANSDQYVGFTLGEELNRKLGASTVVIEKLYWYPELSGNIPNSQNEGKFNYRGTFNFGTVTKLSKWLGWQNAFGDIYVSNPPIGTKQNDIILTTGLNVSFTH